MSETKKKENSQPLSPGKKASISSPNKLNSNGKKREKTADAGGDADDQIVQPSANKRQKTEASNGKKGKPITSDDSVVIPEIMYQTHPNLFTLF